MADEIQRHRIDIVCPECGQTQTEPALVISTQCRFCRANFQVHLGKGVVRTHPVTRFKTPNKDCDAEAELHLESRKPLAPLRKGPVIQPPQSFWMRLFNPTRPPRPITCFTCNHSYLAAGEAQSSQCPKCCGYISLQDHDINTYWNRRIQTGADVFIKKSGLVDGVDIECHNLTVVGAVTGSVKCSGNLVIRSSGKISGKIYCKNLRIEKGAKVDFSNPVIAETAYINGKVRGQIFCTGTVTLEKRAQLQGLIRTSNLITKPGAKHIGSVDTPPSPT